MTVTANDAGVVVETEPPMSQHSYVDWAAIFAGAILAAAISFVLLTFGSAIGLSLTSPYPGQGMSIGWFAIAVVIWMLWVEVSSFMAGAYLTGRLRRRIDDATEHEVDVRDAAHGLLVWALATLIGAGIAASGIAGAAKTAAQVAAGSGLGPAGITFDAAQANSPGARLGSTMAMLFAPSSDAGPGVAARADNGARLDVARLLVRSALQGNLSDTERSYAASIVSTETGLDAKQAGARVEQAYGEVRTAVDQAKAAAERARKLGILAAFITAASLAVSAAASVYAAGRGGRHRDRDLVLPLLAGWK